MALKKIQLDVIDEWFKNGGDETAVLDKYNIPQKKWKKWLADKEFDAAIAEKIKAVQRQSQILIVKYVPMAAAKLIQLCGSDKEETSRKACLDVLALQAGGNGYGGAEGNTDNENNLLDAGIAAKLLAAMAGK